MSESITDDVIKLCFSHLRAKAAGRCSLTCKRYLRSVWSEMQTLETEFFDFSSMPIRVADDDDEYNCMFIPKLLSRDSFVKTVLQQKWPLMTGLQRLELDGKNLGILVKLADASKFMPKLTSVIVGDVVDIRPLLQLSAQRLERLSFWVSDHYDDYEEDAHMLVEYFNRKWPNLRVLEMQIPSLLIQTILTTLPGSVPKLERLKLSPLVIYDFFQDEDEDELDESQKRFSESAMIGFAQLVQQASLSTIEIDGISWEDFLMDIAQTQQLREKILSEQMGALELVATHWHSKCPQLFQKALFNDKTFWGFLWDQYILQGEVVPGPEASFLIFAYHACFSDVAEPPIGESISSLIRWCPPFSSEVTRALSSLFLQRVERNLEKRMPVFSTAFYLLYPAITSEEKDIIVTLKKLLLERFPTSPSALRPSNRLCTVCSNYVDHYRWSRVYAYLLQDSAFCHAAEIDVNDSASGQLLKFVFPRKLYDANCETRIAEFFCDFPEDLLSILKLPNFDFTALRVVSPTTSHFLVSYMLFYIAAPSVVESQYSEECYKITLDRLADMATPANRHLVYRPHTNEFSLFLKNFLARDPTYQAKYDAVFEAAIDDQS